MSDYIDTRDGWREVTDPIERMARPRLVLADENEQLRYWVRERPVPALPIWSVIRYPSAGADLSSTFHVHTPWGWALVDENELRFNARGWQPSLDVDLVSEPRAVTAKAVLDRVRKVMSRAHFSDDAWSQIDAIAQEYES